MSGPVIQEDAMGGINEALAKMTAEREQFKRMADVEHRVRLQAEAERDAARRLAEAVAGSRDAYHRQLVAAERELNAARGQAAQARVRELETACWVAVKWLEEMGYFADQDERMSRVRTGDLTAQRLKKALQPAAGEQKEEALNG